MRFKTDENLPQEAAATLRQAGFDAETVRDERVSGAADEIVATCAQQEARVLITLDLDFANIHAYPPHRHSGIVVLRPITQDKATVLAYIGKILISPTTSKPRRRTVDCPKRPHTVSAERVTVEAPN